MAHSQGVSHATAEAPRYGHYQNDIYAAGVIHNIKPTITKDPNKLEEQAKNHMSATSYSYVAGAAGERATLDANRLAFRQWKVSHTRFFFHSLATEEPTINGSEHRSFRACSVQLQTAHSPPLCSAKATRTPFSAPQLEFSQYFTQMASAALRRQWRPQGSHT